MKLSQLLIVGALAAPLAAQDGFLYASQYLCSSPTAPPLPQANCGLSPCHDTQLSLYNVSTAPAKLRITAVESCPPDEYPPPQFGEVLELTLEPDGAVRIGCDIIDQIVLAQRYVRGERKRIPNGFVRVESSQDIEASVIHAVTSRSDIGYQTQTQVRSVAPRAIEWREGEPD